MRQGFTCTPTTNASPFFGVSRRITATATHTAFGHSGCAFGNHSDYCGIAKNSRSAMIKALFSVLVWGASFVATKVSLPYVEPVTVVGIFLAALGVLLVVTHGNLASLASGKFGNMAFFFCLVLCRSWVGSNSQPGLGWLAWHSFLGGVLFRSGLYILV